MTSKRDREWALLEAANRRFRRRRQAWLEATAGERDFDRAIAHPAWRLVEEANRLLLRIGR